MIEFFNPPDAPAPGAFSRAAGSSLDRVMQMTLLIQDPTDYQESNAEYAAHCPKGLPARHTTRFAVPTAAKVTFACIALGPEAVQPR